MPLRVAYAAIVIFFFARQPLSYFRHVDIVLALLLAAMRCARRYARQRY